MTDELKDVPPDVMMISGPMLREHVEKLFNSTGSLLLSMKGMSYAAGALDAVNAIARVDMHNKKGTFHTMPEQARPEQALDQYTLDFVLSVLQSGASLAVHNMQFVELDLLSKEGVPGMDHEGPAPGVKLS